MALGEGIEWAAHACAVLAALPQGRALSVASLAEFHEVPRAYLAKHMQALARAGVVRSGRGPNGGYSLARPAAEISMWDIRVALEGAEPDFRCQEIRRRGPCPSRPGDARPCTIAAAFWEAERLYREQLSRVSVADIVRAVSANVDAARASQLFAWLERAR
jgi:Rrf2 family protein